MEFTKEDLQKLRGQIELDSLFTSDFKNDMGIDPVNCQNFFDGYTDYLQDMMIDKYGPEADYFDLLPEFDNIDNLYAYYSDCEDCCLIGECVTNELFDNSPINIDISRGGKSSKSKTDIGGNKTVDISGAGAGVAADAAASVLGNGDAQNKKTEACKKKYVTELFNNSPINFKYSSGDKNKEKEVGFNNNKVVDATDLAKDAGKGASASVLGAGNAKIESVNTWDIGRENEVRAIANMLSHKGQGYNLKVVNLWKADELPSDVRGTIGSENDYEQGSEVIEVLALKDGITNEYIEDSVRNIINAAIDNGSISYFPNAVAFTEVYDRVSESYYKIAYFYNFHRDEEQA